VLIKTASRRRCQTSTKPSLPVNRKSDVDSSVTWRWKLAAAEWPDWAARRGCTEAEVIRHAIDRPTYLWVRTRRRRRRRSLSRQRRRFTHASLVLGRPPGHLYACRRPLRAASRFRRPASHPRRPVRPLLIADSSSRGSAGKQRAGPGRPVAVRPLFTPTCVRASQAFLVIISLPNEWDAGMVVYATEATQLGNALCWSFISGRMERDDLIMIRCSPARIYFTSQWRFTLQRARPTNALSECLPSLTHGLSVSITLELR